MHNLDDWMKYWNNPILEYEQEGYNAYNKNKYTENPYDAKLEPEKYYSWQYGRGRAYDDQVLVDMGR